MTKVLFLGANPADATRLALDREVREITQRLRASPYSSTYELVQEWALRLEDIQAALLRHKPQVVHFSGHSYSAGADRAGSGTPRVRDVTDEQAGVADRGGELMVEDDAGEAVPIPSAALAELVRIVGGIQCVVLNACHSAAQAEALQTQVRFVLGMERAIPDRAAIAFAGAFYQALGFGESVHRAFELGKNQLRLIGSYDCDVPKLFVRDGVAPHDSDLVDHAPGAARAMSHAGTGRASWRLTSILYYYCYISESKVDQLLSQFSLDVPTDAAAEAFRWSHGQLGQMIHDAYTLDGQFGHPAVSSIHWSRERRRDLVLKLLAALAGIERTASNPRSLREIAQRAEIVRPGMYIYEGEFSTRRFDREFAYLESPVIDGTLLKLTCSLRYFSDVCDASGHLRFHSGNADFLSGGVSIPFHTMLYVLQSKDGSIVGTPLFLGLPLDSPVQL